MQTSAKTVQTSLVLSRDSRQYIGDQLNWWDRLTKTRESGKLTPVFTVMVADVKALYLSLCRSTVSKALECSLDKYSNYNTKAGETFVELNKIHLSNVVTQRADQHVPQTKGIITGDIEPLSHWQTLLCITSYSWLLVCYVRHNFSADLSMTWFG